MQSTPVRGSVPLTTRITSAPPGAAAVCHTAGGNDSAHAGRSTGVAPMASRNGAASASMAMTIAISGAGIGAG